MIQNILVLCTGNICRSPMGEALFAAKLSTKSLPGHVSSAGIGALVGKPADPLARKLMQQKGLDISSHLARQISPEMLLDADLIFTMSSGQQQEIEDILPSIRGRVFRLGKWGGYDIPDPFRRPFEAFEQAFSLIEQGVEDWSEKLWN